VIDRRRHWLPAALAILSLGTTQAGAEPLQNLTGNWSRNDGGTRIAIAPCGANLCAINTWVQNPNGKEKRGDELILTPQPATSPAFKFQAYDVRRKLDFKMTITIQGTAMHTCGCVLLGIVCKGADWTRMN